MEFDREVFDLMPSGNKIFNLIGLKMPSDKDIFFRAKQKETLDKYQAARRFMYELEADVLNMALFGMTAKEWCDANPDLKGNIRNYANVSLYIANACLEKAKSQIYLDVLLKYWKSRYICAIISMEIMVNSDNACF